ELRAEDPWRRRASGARAHPGRGILAGIRPTDGAPQPDPPAQPDARLDALPDGHLAVVGATAPGDTPGDGEQEAKVGATPHGAVGSFPHPPSAASRMEAAPGREVGLVCAVASPCRTVLGRCAAE